MVAVKEKLTRSEESKMDILVVGAGLGGLGAAIGLLLAGHNVRVLEAASAMGEVGAGIQCLPNAARVLEHWGLARLLAPHATRPTRVTLRHWTGRAITSLDLGPSAAQDPGTCYWDFHRADLHRALVERATQLGGRIETNARVVDVRCAAETATAVLHDGRTFAADLIVGADGIASRLREVLAGTEAGADPPTPTGDLAYRLLLSTAEMRKDPELAAFVTDPQVNYWLGPDKHAVNYVLRGGELFNMVLLVPDDIPGDGASTVAGNVEEMRQLYDGWDPRISKLLRLCESVYKWRLCIRQPMDSWFHPSATFTLLGDAVHATLPYLASGAGMSFEDAAVLGEVFSRITAKSAAQKRYALRVYEKCRKARTEMVVERGNLQQYLYHLHDGEEQEARDRAMREVPTRGGEALVWRDPAFAPQLLGYDHLIDVDLHWGNDAAGKDDPEWPDEVAMEPVSNGVGSTDEVDATPVISVLVVGAGPAGLMLATNLARFGIDVEVVDDRPSQTWAGRADGLQPKTIETLKQMRLAETLLRRGVKVYDICFWESTSTAKLVRQSRQIHYPRERVDTLDPYVLLVHQGMIEDVFLEDLKARGVEVCRSQPFIECKTNAAGLVETSCIDDAMGAMRTKLSKYVVGCDGAHSRVRRSLPGVAMAGESGRAAWGVLDGVFDTDFPDLWSKTVVHSGEEGAMLIIPRERNLTRLYIELHPVGSLTADKIENQDFVMRRAQEIIAPYHLTFQSIEWFSVYRVGQRVASAFSSPDRTIYIAGDAAHTHSPKAAQGMNVSMHDTFNLAWKLNLTLRGLASAALLDTYETERRQIAQELIDFDHEHAQAFVAGDAAALARNFNDNIRFISGVGAEYKANALNVVGPGAHRGALGAGKLLPPARATRYIDANPVDLQLDIPLLGQFRAYFFLADAKAPRAHAFLADLCSFARGTASTLGRAARAATRSYADTPPAGTDESRFEQAGRYVAASRLVTFALVTTMPQAALEIADLPALLRASRWTVYLDEADGVSGACTAKYLGGLAADEVAMVLVRPDGYVASVGRWHLASDAQAAGAAKAWLDGYFQGFLEPCL